MLHGAPIKFEIRSENGATRLTGAFPYNSQTTLGNGRREQFAPGSFRARIESGEPIYLLAGHDIEKPLASTAAGSLTLRDSAEALHLDAYVVPTTSWAQDALAALAAGLTKGISPGFRVPQGGETVSRSADGLLRTVTKADLFEFSLVTRPAYDAAQMSARSWDLTAPAPRPLSILRYR
jgi:HK97 family phage prohead protease